MMPKPLSGKRHPSAADGDATNTRFLHDLEALGKALSLDPKPSRRALLPPPPLPDHRTTSAGRSLPDPKPKSKPSSEKNKKSSSSISSSSSSSFWNWKPLKKLSHIGQRRFDCYFNLTVHSIDSLPPALSDGAELVVHWKRTTDPASAAAATRPARTFGGSAEFDETLSHRCPVYGARSGGPHNSAKYDPRHFLIWAALADAAPGAADLGRNLVDLTRLLPLTLEQLEEEEKGTGRWSTSFRLSGKARGATLSVSFGFSLVGEDPSGSGRGDERKAPEILNSKLGRMDRFPSRGRNGGIVRSRDRSRSVEDIKVLHEVLPSSKSDAVVLAEAESELENQELENGKLDTWDANANSKMEFEANDDLPVVKPCKMQESVGEDGEKDCDEHEFMVIEQGIEIATKHQLGENRSEEVKIERLDEGGGMVGQNKEVGVKTDELVEDLTCQDDFDLKKSSSSQRDPNVEDLDSALRGLSILESEVFESPQATTNAGREMSYNDFETKPGNVMNCSPGLDDLTNSVASEFLNMLGIEHSPFGLSSDSDPESPRERLWKQFEKESLAVGDGIFGLDMGMERGSSATVDAIFGLDMGMEWSSATDDDIFGFDIGAEEPSWGDISDDLDLTKIVLEAETELQKATQGMDSKSRAKMLEDAETEALMREWGLNEKAFHRSPPGSRSGFGSPIDLPPEEPLELPPLGEGLGPFLQTKDGGFVRSMNPSLFKNAKNNGSLVMQVSSPVVVPAEMGSGIMDILQGLASVGIEKLSMQAKKLMPLEEISGKTMQQIAWEASPALEACERQEFLQDPNAEVESGIGQSAPARKTNKSKSLNRSSSSNGEMGSEYVSIEDLAPLAMDKIETISIEGLRIQSGMSDNEAPSNISPQSIGDISALEGKKSTNCRSLGLEGAAGLQLMDVKDSDDDIDGLMSLSITLDEWMRLDSGIVDEEEISERTSKILAAHHACSTDFSAGGLKGDKRGGKRSGRRWGLLGNNFTVALLVQLRDPLRDYEPVGTPMLALIQVERVFVPPKPKIYDVVSEKGNSEQDDEPDTNIEAVVKEEKKEEEDVPQFKITEVHVAGLKTEPEKKKLWGNPRQQQSGSRWLLATGMGKSNKNPFMKSKAGAESSQVTTTGDSLWSISSRLHGTGGRWKELNPHKRNPNVILPNQSARLR